MKVWVIGRGLLGSDLVAELAARGHVVTAPSRRDFDIANPVSVAQITALGDSDRPDWLVNCAAYTKVDQAEFDRDAAFELNAYAPGLLAQACALGGIRLLHLSTDFVFDGAKNEPYLETDSTGPLCVYGESKLQGEHAVLSASPDALVVRTAWLFGANGPCFPKSILSAWTARKALRVVADQVGSPTYTRHLSASLEELMKIGPPGGILHCAGPEAASWHELAVRTLRAYARFLGEESEEVNVEAISSSDWPTAARRPAYSVLSNEQCNSLGVPPMPPLEQALDEFIEDLSKRNSGD